MKTLLLTLLLSVSAQSVMAADLICEHNNNETSTVTTIRTALDEQGNGNMDLEKGPFGEREAKYYVYANVSNGVIDYMALGESDTESGINKSDRPNTNQGSVHWGDVYLSCSVQK